MGILAWNAEGEVCPLGNNKFFSASPSPHLSPLILPVTIREKEYLQIPVRAEIPTFAVFSGFPYNEATKEVDGL